MKCDMCGKYVWLVHYIDIGEKVIKLMCDECYDNWYFKKWGEDYE